jgi:hypothetical protein
LFVCLFVSAGLSTVIPDFKDRKQGNKGKGKVTQMDGKGERVVLWVSLRLGNPFFGALWCFLFPLASSNSIAVTW